MIRHYIKLYTSNIINKNKTSFVRTLHGFRSDREQIFMPRKLWDVRKTKINAGRMKRLLHGLILQITNPNLSGKISLSRKKNYKKLLPQKITNKKIHNANKLFIN